MNFNLKFFILLFTTTLSSIFITNFFNYQARENITLGEENQVKVNDTCAFFKWFDPNTTDKEGKQLLKNCSSCHMAYYEEWSNDKHSMSQNNPFFLTIYGGTDIKGKQNIYPGFKLDHPNQNGNCALCHNPEAAIDNNFDIDLRIAKNTHGISCDFCHKIKSVDQNKLKFGVKGLNIIRAEGLEPGDELLSSCKGLKDIRFGPIKDPVQPSKHEELKYNSLYKTSLYCAKCHDGGNGNVLMYSTFTEWLKSPAAKRGVQCQTCHMKPRNESSELSPPTSFYSIVDNPKIKHKKRPYNEVHSHSFLTNDAHNFRKEYIDLKLTAKKENNKIIVDITVENNNFGHSFPTGSPMRNAFVVIEVKDKTGKELKQLTGSKLPLYAGNLNGKPGKFFAKILEETSSEYAVRHEREGIAFRKLAQELGIPAQDWWNVYIAQDTRIKANKKDVSTYEFALDTVIARSISDEAISIGIASPSARNDIQINAKLIWRNTWPGLAKVKGLELNEDLLIEKKISL